MKRRRFISTIATILPVVVVGTEVFFSSCTSNPKGEIFDKDYVILLDEIGETIIPASSTSPGAKAAKIGAFMKVYVTDCYDAAQQKTFFEAINKIKILSKSKYGKEFLNLTISQRHDLLNILEKEGQEHTEPKNTSTAGIGDAIQAGKAKQEDESKMKGETNNYFSMIKDLTLFGYFTSEPGTTKALRYVQTPGSYQGNVPYKEGDKAWAT